MAAVPTLTPRNHSSRMAVSGPVMGMPHPLALASDRSRMFVARAWVLSIASHTLAKHSLLVGLAALAITNSMQNFVWALQALSSWTTDWLIHMSFRMKEIGAFEAKNRLGTLLDWVEQGEEVIITRRGKAVARMVPAQRRADPEEARAAGRRIRERAEKLKPPVTLEEIKEWINEGRP
jgi:prevent-host-death family protein